MEFFGDDSSDDEGNSSTAAALRPKENGLMVFHAGTEQAMLVYVTAKIESSPEPPSPQLILSLIDDFCIERHWMMHIGPEKSDILQDALTLAIANSANPADPFALLEVGTYCGYSAVLLSNKLLRLLPAGRPFHLYSFELDPKNAAVATEIVRLAGLASNVTISVADSVEEGLASLPQPLTLDALFLDHDKDLYKADMQVILESKRNLNGAPLLPSKSVCIADNVVMGRITDYLEFVRGDARFSESKLYMSSIEYSKPDLDLYSEDDVKDGVEVSVLR
jgi:catechol O-methyltransferase